MKGLYVWKMKNEITITKLQACNKAVSIGVVFESSNLKSLSESSVLFPSLGSRRSSPRQNHMAFKS